MQTVFSAWANWNRKRKRVRAAHEQLATQHDRRAGQEVVEMWLMASLKRREKRWRVDSATALYSRTLLWNALASWIDALNSKRIREVF